MSCEYPFDRVMNVVICQMSTYTYAVAGMAGPVLKDQESAKVHIC